MTHLRVVAFGGSIHKIICESEALNTLLAFLSVLVLSIHLAHILPVWDFPNAQVGAILTAIAPGDFTYGNTTYNYYSIWY